MALENQRLPLPTTSDVAPPPPPPAPEPAAPSGPPLTAEEIKEVEKQVVAALHTCFDPEIPVNIYELGLIYNIAVEPVGAVGIKMTLTSPACPVAGTLPGDVRARVQRVPRVTSAKVDVVWEPPWHKGLMSEAAKLQLGIDD